jgi:hypothetical protein
MCSRARWLDSEAKKLGLALKSGEMTSNQVDEKLAEMGALDLVYPELTGISSPAELHFDQEEGR